VVVKVGRYWFYMSLYAASTNVCSESSPWKANRSIHGSKVRLDLRAAESILARIVHRARLLVSIANRLKAVRFLFHSPDTFAMAGRSSAGFASLSFTTVSMSEFPAGASEREMPFSSCRKLHEPPVSSSLLTIFVPSGGSSSDLSSDFKTCR
jgi:hypothetical protein